MLEMRVQLNIWTKATRRFVMKIYKSFREISDGDFCWILCIWEKQWWRFLKWRNLWFFLGRNILTEQQLKNILKVRQWSQSFLHLNKQWWRFLKCMNLKGCTGEQHGFVLSMHFQTGANAANSSVSGGTIFCSLARRQKQCIKSTHLLFHKRSS